mgnify:CR=1 FL=1
MADKTMPPTEAPTPTPDAMPMDMGAAPDMATPTGGKVMVEMPSDKFDDLYSTVRQASDIINQVTTVLDALKADVEAQKQGSVGGEPAPAQSAAPAAPAAASASDEEFLKNLAQEGSMR